MTAETNFVQKKKEEGFSETFLFLFYAKIYSKKQILFYPGIYHQVLFTPAIT